nr:MAG TPA_asm: hypothetical protein [Bacteriophage sp.]
MSEVFFSLRLTYFFIRIVSFPVSFDSFLVDSIYNSSYISPVNTKLSII